MTDPRVQSIFLFILLLSCLARDNSFGSRCTAVDFERPATVTITHQSSDGAEIGGYVEVRKGAYLFWSHYKSPHRVSSPEQPWPTVFYAAPAASSGGDGNFNGNGAPPLEPRNSTWLHNADLLIVDTPVGTGYSYEDDAIKRNGLFDMAETAAPLIGGGFRKAAADVLVVLRALTREIPALQSSPLILLNSTYGGSYGGKMSTVVGLAIRVGALTNLTVGSGGDAGLVKRFDSSTTPERDQISDPGLHICVSHPAEPPMIGGSNTKRKNSLSYYVCMYS